MRQPANRAASRSAWWMLVALQLAWAPPLAAQGAIESIASELICLCGCYRLLNVCEMDTAKQMKAVISEKLEAGWEKKEILAYMTDTYGEQVLAAPPKRGFNLTAWVTPFGAIFGGAVVIWLVIGAWVHRRQRAREDELATVASTDLEAKYGARLEQELREYGR